MLVYLPLLRKHSLSLCFSRLIPKQDRIELLTTHSDKLPSEDQNNRKTRAYKLYNACSLKTEQTVVLFVSLSFSESHILRMVSISN